MIVDMDGGFLKLDEKLGLWIWMSCFLTQGTEATGRYLKYVHVCTLCIPKQFVSAE